MDRSLVTVWEKHDGDKVTKGTYFGSVTGSTRSLLVAERLALNLMQRMSGIASATRAMVDAVGKHHTRILGACEANAARCVAHPAVQIRARRLLACGCWTSWR